MVKRWISGFLGAVAAANGIFMLIDGQRWYASIPSVSETGPFNPHFVADIGAAFLIAGLALIARAWRPQYWPAALAGAGFLGAHGLIHVLGILGGHSHHAGFETLSVIVPSALALWASLPAKGESHA